MSTWKEDVIAACRVLREEWDVIVADGCKVLTPAVADAIEGVFLAIGGLKEYGQDAWPIVAALNRLAEPLEDALRWGDDWQRHTSNADAWIPGVLAVLKASEHLEADEELPEFIEFERESPEELEEQKVPWWQRAAIYDITGKDAVKRYKQAVVDGTLERTVRRPAPRPAWLPLTPPPLVTVMHLSNRFRDKAADSAAAPIRPAKVVLDDDLIFDEAERELITESGDPR